MDKAILLTIFIAFMLWTALLISYFFNREKDLKEKYDKKLSKMRWSLNQSYDISNISIFHIDRLDRRIKNLELEINEIKENNAKSEIIFRDLIDRIEKRVKQLESDRD